MEILLKQCIEDDWRTVGEFEKSAASKVFHPLETEEDLKKYIKNSVVFFIILDDKKIGTVSYEKKEDGSVYFDGLTILPDYRGKGIASQAMKRVLDNLENEKLFTLHVHPENTPALIVYLRLGFQIKDWHNNVFGDNQARLYLERSI